MLWDTLMVSGYPVAVSDREDYLHIGTSVCLSFLSHWLSFTSPHHLCFICSFIFSLCTWPLEVPKEHDLATGEVAKPWCLS